MSRTRILVSLLAGLAVIGGGFWAFTPRAIRVETAAVTSGRFTATVEETGRTRVRERYVVSSPMAGRLIRPTLRPGDAVEQGQTIATLRASPSSLLDPRARQELEERIGMAEASLEEASAAQERARVLLARARTDLDRTRQLRATGAAALAQFERDTFAFEAAERDVVAADRRRHAAEHAVAQMRALIRPGGEGNGDTVALSAPVAGRVLKVVQESEGAVAAGAPLIEIGDPGHRGRGRSADDRRCPPSRGRAGLHQWLGRPGAAPRPCPPCRALRLHQAVGPRRRGAAGLGADRHCRSASTAGGAR